MKGQTTCTILFLWLGGKTVNMMMLTQSGNVCNYCVINMVVIVYTMAF